MGRLIDPDFNPRSLLPLNLAALSYGLDMLGVIEYGGENKGEMVEQFLREAEVFEPAPWCAAFVNWCAFKGAEAVGVPSPLEEVPLQAYVQSYYLHGQDRGWEITEHEAGPGDLFLLYYKNLKRYGHIGFVYEMREDDGWFSTVEGNTNKKGHREGDGVYSKTRLITPSVVFYRWT